MRAVIDHHVDRPGVHAQQRAQPTGPNRPNARPSRVRAPGADPSRPAPNRANRATIIPQHPQTHLDQYTHKHTPIPPSHPKPGLRPRGGLADLVAMADGDPPDPIPNSAVKPSSAHDTAAQAAGQSVAARSANPPPTSHPKTGPHRAPPNGNRQRGVEQPGSSSGS